MSTTHDCESFGCEPFSPDGLECKHCGAEMDPPTCAGCGDEGATYAPCPYAADIHGDDTPMWLCDLCRYNRAQDI